jgi:hypothetical protein
MFSLFNMPHHNSTARIPQSLITPRHQPFIAIPSSTFTTTQPGCWRNGEFQQLSQVASPTDLHPFLSILSILISYLRNYSSTPYTQQDPKLFPSSSLLTIIRAASLLSFISHTSREKPPCILCSSHGEIPAAKLMMANKTKLNLKNMLCSH